MALQRTWWASKFSFFSSLRHIMAPSKPFKFCTSGRISALRCPWPHISSLAPFWARIYHDALYCDSGFVELWAVKLTEQRSPSITFIFVWSYILNIYLRPSEIWYVIPWVCLYTLLNSLKNSRQLPRPGMAHLRPSPIWNKFSFGSFTQIAPGHAGLAEESHQTPQEQIEETAHSSKQTDLDPSSCEHELVADLEYLQLCAAFDEQANEVGEELVWVPKDKPANLILLDKREASSAENLCE